MNTKLTNKDVIEALKLYNKTNLKLDDPDRTNSLMHRKLTLEEVLRVVSIVVLPTNKYNMENIKQISVSNIMIDKLAKELYKDSKDVDKKLDKMWEDASREYDKLNKKKLEQVKKSFAKAGDVDAQ